MLLDYNNNTNVKYKNMNINMKDYDKFILLQPNEGALVTHIDSQARSQVQFSESDKDHEPGLTGQSHLSSASLSLSFPSRNNKLRIKQVVNFKIHFQCTGSFKCSLDQAFHQLDIAHLKKKDFLLAIGIPLSTTISNYCSIE